MVLNEIAFLEGAESMTDETIPKREKSSVRGRPKMKPEPYGGSRQYLTPDEVDKVIAVVKKFERNRLRNLMIVLLSYRHALRVSELVRIQWSDIDFNNATIYVHRSKGGISGRQPLSGDEIRYLRKMYSTRKNNVFAFTTETGSPLTTKAVKTFYERLRDKVDVPVKLHSHVLRHSCGHYLAEKGVDATTAKDYMGHRDIQSTMIYMQGSSRRFTKLWEN